MFKIIMTLAILVPITVTIFGVKYYSNPAEVYPVAECSINDFSMKDFSNLESNPIEECIDQENQTKSRT